MEFLSLVDDLWFYAVCVASNSKIKHHFTKINQNNFIQHFIGEVYFLFYVCVC